MSEVESQRPTISQWEPSSLEVRFKLPQCFFTTTRKNCMKISEEEFVFTSPILFCSAPHSKNTFVIIAPYKGSNGEIHYPYFFTSLSEHAMSCACSKLNTAIAKKCKIVVRQDKNEAVFRIIAPSEAKEKLLIKSFKFLDESLNSH